MNIYKIVPSTNLSLAFPIRLGHTILKNKYNYENILLYTYRIKIMKSLWT